MTLQVFGEDAQDGKPLPSGGLEFGVGSVRDTSVDMAAASPAPAPDVPVMEDQASLREALRVDLSRYDNSWYHPGRGFLIRILWHLTNAIVLQNPLNPSSCLKILVLRLFGARIGRGVVIKPAVNVKYPWNLSVGDHTWIGEGVWLDSLSPISIGSNACISQGAYLCTGNHNWSDPRFRLVIRPITVEDGAWVGARAIILPGVTLGTHSVAAAGAVVTSDAPAWMVCVGNPAAPIKRRRLRAAEDSTPTT